MLVHWWNFTIFFLLSSFIVVCSLVWSDWKGGKVVQNSQFRMLNDLLKLPMELYNNMVRTDEQKREEMGKRKSFNSFIVTGNFTRFNWIHQHLYMKFESILCAGTSEVLVNKLKTFSVRLLSYRQLIIDKVNIYACFMSHNFY